MADGRRIENRFDRQPDFSEILRGKAVFHRISAMGQIPTFCFPNMVWASARGGFRIVSDTLVVMQGVQMKCVGKIKLNCHVTVATEATDDECESAVRQCTEGKVTVKDPPGEQAVLDGYCQ